MRNLWIQTERPFATWSADLSVLRDEPIELLNFIATVLDAGARHKVFQVLEAPAIDYRYGRDGDLLSRLLGLYHSRHIVELFGFTGAAMAPWNSSSSAVRAILSWFDKDDCQVEGEVVDLGDLLRNLEPAEHAIPVGFMKHYPPLRITGPRLVYGGDDARELQDDERFDHSIVVRFAVHSDIWFPWVPGSAHPLCDHQRMFDNRVLATCHTPRLNAFLCEAARVTGALGGRWQVDSGETAKGRGLEVDKLGIRIDADPPAKLMPPAALNARWY